MREWYFQVMGQELGPFSAPELKSKVDTGQIQPDTMIRRGADGKWLFADKVKGLLPERPAPVLPAVPAAKTKSSSSMPTAEVRRSEAASKSPESVKEIERARSDRQIPVITMSLGNDEDRTDADSAPSSEFYDFVGFREAISPVLHTAVRQYLANHHLSMTQLNRRALASFIARPELASDLMISNIAPIPQPVNEKFNRDGSHPLSERERAEMATFRLTLFNCSNHTLEVIQGEFVPESVKVREYDVVGTTPIPAISHQGHVVARLDGVREGQAIPLALNITISPLAAETVVVWFRSSSKSGVSIIRGQLQFGVGDELALSDPVTVILHGDSP